MPSVRIQSEGPNGSDTVVTNAETGAHIPGVTEARVRMSCGEPNRVSLDISLAEVDIVAELSGLFVRYDGNRYRLVLDNRGGD